MPHKINDFDKIPTIIYSHFAKELSTMTFLFCHKTEKNKYNIFQEITSLPLKELKATIHDYSIGGAVSWNAWDNIDAMIANVDKEPVERWKHLLDNTRINNMPNGTFSNGSWALGNRGNPPVSWNPAPPRGFNLLPVPGQNKKTKKNKNSMKEKFNTFFEFKIINAYAFYLFRWGFEIISDNISWFAVRDNFLFPHVLRRSGEDGPDSMVEDDEDLNYAGSGTHRTARWNGMHFVVDGSPNFADSSFISYWIKEDRIDDDFDKEMEMLIDRDKVRASLDVGQRKVNLDV